MIENRDRILTHDEVIRHYLEDEMSSFRFPEKLHDFVDNMDKSTRVVLLRALSKWRKNNMDEKILPHKSWRMIVSEADRIIVGRINDDVNPLLERNGFSLEKIILDKDIGMHREFESQGDISLRTLLGRMEAGKARIIDGNHRAIRMGLDGTKEFEIIIPINDSQDINDS